MPAINPITTQINRASFTIWSKDEIRKISVKKITEPKSFEAAGAFHPEGLYSLALGPAKRFEICTTCGLNDMSCPGHFGHIELSVPVYHPMLVQVLYQLLSKCCLECFHFRLSQASLKLFLAQLDALNCGFDHLIDELDEIANDMCRDKGDDDLEYIHVILGKKLVARIEEEKEKDPEFDCQNRPQQRSIVERLSKLFRNFINGHLIKPAKICPNCGEKKIPMSLHHQAVIMVGANSSKPDEEATSAGPKKRKSKKTRVIETSETGWRKHGKLVYLRTDEKQYLTPVGARKFLRELWKNEKRTMQSIFHFLKLDSSQVSSEKVDVKQEDDDDAHADEVDDEDEDPKRLLKKEEQFQPVDLFFIDTILVPPPKFRPPMSQRGYSYEGPRTGALSSVMKQSIIVQDMIDKLVSEPDEIESEMLQPKVQSKWRELQVAVNCVFDNEMDKYSKSKPYPGLKQLIDKKEGLFRKHMMGKRVNFAARSVISPDPNISVDQIGVPLVFAKKLTYPCAVTPWNINQLKEAVLNGPDKYPGAHSVVYDDGRTVSLAKETVRQAVAARLTYSPPRERHPSKRMSSGATLPAAAGALQSKPSSVTPLATIVNRHLLSGDVLLFNRQPTLHKPSIMAFRARVLPNEKGFRLHYANCKSFNADFDGDEMNAHLPQSELARSEALNIASVNHQYLVPKDGSPLGGLIQDHVVAVCVMTRRDQFFDKDRYQQLVYCALAFLEKPLKLEPPTFLRPAPLWTGKQVITTIIKNCIPDGRLYPTLDIKSKIGPKILGIKPEEEHMSDCNVIIRNGELLVGFMDKSNVGATQYGLVHTCYELYGGETSSNLMSAFARLSTWYLQLYEGFTLGIGDILIDDEANEDRAQLIEESRHVGPDSAKEALNLVDSDGQVRQDIEEQNLEDKLRAAHADRDPTPMKRLDASMKSRTDKFASNISSRCLPDGLIRRFPDNNLQMMIQSGAKGGTVNALQISCLLGQIELEGRRVPLSMSGRTLPSFKPYDTSPKAGGFVSGRFLTGIQPQEFFFHCMAGREGLIDTAVKTSRSGYLQRCLIKHLEGLTVHYDQTVRDSCGSVVQFLYGEDGLDIVKSQMLKDKALSLLVENYNIIKSSDDEIERLNSAKQAYEDEVIERLDDIKQWQMRNGDDRIRKIRGSGFLDFLASRLSEVREKKARKSAEIEEVAEKEDKEEKPASSQSGLIGSHHHDQIFDDWYSLSFKEKKKWNKVWEICPDPLTAIMNPASHFGAVPELLDERIEKFVKKNPNLIVDAARLLGAAEDEYESMMYDDNPELSKSIWAYCGQSIRTSDKPRLTKHEFYNLCYNLYMKMLAQPGEAVGLLAAQSIGEPSTQMTLNTFHFAGRGEMNVTLGIPRLREILMTASAKIGTPSMDLPLLKNMSDELGNPLGPDAVEEQTTQVRLALNAVRLSDVLEFVDLTESVHIDIERSRREAMTYGGKKKKSRKRKRDDDDEEELGSKTVRYEILFSVLPSRFYKHEFKCSSSRALKFIEEVFAGQLVDSMIKRQKRLLMSEKLFDLSTRRGMKEKAGTGKKGDREGSGSAADANGNGDQDEEEKDLDDYNAKASEQEKAKDADAETSSEEEEEVDGGDNTAHRMRSRRNQDLDYEEPEEDDLEVGDLEAKTAQDEEGEVEILNDDELQIISPDEQATDDTKHRQQPNKDSSSPDDVEGEEDEDIKPAGKSVELAGLEDLAKDSKSGKATPALKRPKMSAEDVLKEASSKLDVTEIERRKNQVKSIGYVLDYEFDTKRERWCKLTVALDLTTSRLDMGALIESEAKRTFIHRVGNISRALIVKNSNNEKIIKTEGVSLLSLVRFNHILDLNAIYTNDIHAIANTYGIEAASQAIRREMANVFAVYGIEVDPRHLSLIADYMTYNGHIRGMNRMSMEASASPFQQMSFESTIRYLKWAAILGLYDDIKSPSAALVFGRPTRGGTGQFGLLADDTSQASGSSRARREHHRETINSLDGDYTSRQEAAEE